MEKINTDCKGRTLKFRLKLSQDTQTVTGLLSRAAKCLL